MSATGPDYIRIVLVDDHSVIRHGLRAVLETESDLAVVGEATEAGEGFTVCQTTKCHVALVDLRLRASSGLDLIRALSRSTPACRSIVLTNYLSTEDVQNAIAVDAKGYLLKHAEPSEIITAIRAVYSGRRYLSDEVRKAGGLSPLDPLTERELQVLQLLVPGTRNRVIAQTLGLTEGTVKNYVKNILYKMGARGRTDAATRAIQRGLVRRTERS